MELEIDFLKQLALNIYDEVHPILGTSKASQKFSRGAGGDISMQIDLLAEKILIETLEKASINILLISEEIGEKYIGNKELALKNKNVLIVDPIDGSNNAARGIPYCSVSIAYAIGSTANSIKKAVVLDLVTKDIFWAVKGEGAYLNEEGIHVSDLGINDRCYCEINLSKKSMFKNIDNIRSILQQFHRVRILGSSALTLCQIAKGSMEAFINLRDSNRLVDVAAGFLILQEAGGKMMFINGDEINGELSINLRFPFFASNLKLVSFLIKNLNQEK
jgi:myo-inositol-1(or 4)-monophosphatase